MSSAVTTLPSMAPAKSPKKRAKCQRKKTVSDLILKATSASSERGSVSLAALKKALKAGGYDVEKNKARILSAIRRLVANKSLVQTKGTGASGSFKRNNKPPTPRKTKVVKKNSKAKRVRRASVKKADGGATPAAKKSPKKNRKPRSPKKAKRPAVTKKPRSSKKAKRRVVTSIRTRAAAKKC